MDFFWPISRLVKVLSDIYIFGRIKQPRLALRNRPFFESNLAYSDFAN